MNNLQHRIISAADGLAARVSYEAFVKKWTTLCPAAARSIEEAGYELLTFRDFPKPMWKSLRTTNSLENLTNSRRSRPLSALHPTSDKEPGRKESKIVFRASELDSQSLLCQLLTILKIGLKLYALP